MVKLLKSQRIGQKEERSWVPLPTDSQRRECEICDTPPRLSCSERRRLHRPSKVLPKFGSPQYLTQLQGKVRLPLMRILGIGWCSDIYQYLMNQVVTEKNSYILRYSSIHSRKYVSDYWRQWHLTREPNNNKRYFKFNLIKCTLPPSHILPFPALTYPLPRVHTVILNIGVARVCTLIAVDGSGKWFTVLVLPDWGVYEQKLKVELLTCW